MTSHHGQCHCGQTEWTVKLDDSNHILCHCNTCKSISGGAYTLNAIVPLDNFKLTKGKLNVYTYTGDSGKAVKCYYCPNCTSHPYHHQEALGEDKIVVRTVLLDDGQKFQPGAEIYGKDKMSWEPKVAETFEVLPPN